LKYKLIPELIPNSLDERATYWKKYYNSEAGKGTMKHYLEMNDFDMDLYNEDMEVLTNKISKVYF